MPLHPRYCAPLQSDSPSQNIQSFETGQLSIARFHKALSPQGSPYRHHRTSASNTLKSHDKHHQIHLSVSADLAPLLTLISMNVNWSYVT